MRIGIDIRSLQNHHRYRGIGVYVSHLLEHIAKLDRKNDYVLFLAENKKKPELMLTKHFKYNLAFIPAVEENLKTKIKTAYKPLPWSTDKWKLDIFFQPNLEDGLPSGNAKTIATFYDLIPILFKSHYYPRRQLSKAWLVQKVLFLLYKRNLHTYKNLGAVISISDSSRQDLLKFDKGLDPHKIKTIHLGVDLPSKSKIIFNIAWPNKKYFLYVGSCDFRKNVDDIVEAFTFVREQGVEASLVLVGRDFVDEMPTSLRQTIGNCRYKKDIIMPGFVSPEELSYLYKNAEAFVFASLYEGFGMPPLEAMAASCPVISYKNSSLPDVLDNAALWCKSPDEMADAMIKLLDEPKLREVLINRGIERANMFSWKTTAKKTLEVFEKIND